MVECDAFLGEFGPNTTDFLSPVAVTNGRSRGVCTSWPKVDCKTFSGTLPGGRGGTNGSPVGGGRPQLLSCVIFASNDAFTSERVGITFIAGGTGSTTFASIVQSRSGVDVSSNFALLVEVIGALAPGGVPFGVRSFGVSFWLARMVRKSLRDMRSGSTSTPGPGLVPPFSLSVTPIFTTMDSISEGCAEVSSRKYSIGAVLVGFFFFFVLSFFSASNFFLFLGSSKASASNSSGVFCSFTTGPIIYCGSFSGSILFSTKSFPLWS
mmetsp:Transcript_705/g.1250  ORF Transcript_705/g.1250 Transcript_705/m.1250 type:complete len:266 (+) Transcript_705:171-968(+)